MKRLLLSVSVTLACLPLLTFAQSSGVDLSAIDKTADPCQDFYKYACGSWMAQNPVPSQFARWGRFDELQDRNLTVLRDVLEDAAKHQKRSANDQKIGAFYESCMDESRVNRQGADPLKPGLKQIKEMQGKAGLATEIARLHNEGVNVLFRFGSSADLDNARMEAAEADQGGLGLPDKEFYTRKDPKSEETRRRYVQHIANMFQLLGDSDSVAGVRARAVMLFESGLAQASLTRTERRDPTLLHHKMSLSQFEASMPDFDFSGYLAALPAPQFNEVNVTEPDFFKAMSHLLATTTSDDLKSYLTWHYVSTYAPVLSSKFVDENFDFYRRYLTGAKELRPRWKRCVETVDDNLGDALGQGYVAKAFAGQSKQQTQALVQSIEAQMEKDLNSLTWMSDPTKQQALNKLRGVTNKIGYPAQWKDYSTVTISGKDLVGNVERSTEFESHRDLNKIGQPVDRNEFHMTPPTVNAYYSPSENNINFPAGILQPPFFNSQADMAVNYGAIGAVIGHELTHGFDDQGRQFDADGNLRDWWTQQDADEFKRRADCIADEYSKFSPVAGATINGRLTLGENGADNAGIRLAFMALSSALQSGNVQNQKLDGYTPEQRFFLGYAQVWCQNVRPEEALRRVQIDPHSPGEFRVNGVVQNSPEFGHAFGCSEGSPMVSANACRVW
jgi:putative endopeptidase